MIFSEIYDGKSGKGHSWDMWQNPSGYNAWAGGQQNCVYLEFVESYENIDGSDPTIDREKVAQYYTWTLDELWGKKDPRFKASIYTQGTPWTHEGASVTLDYHVGIFVDEQWINDGFYEGVPGAGRLREQLAPHAVRHPEIPRRVVGHDPRALLLENRLDRLPGSAKST